MIPQAHICTATDTHTVRLTTTEPGGSDTLARTNYITASSSTGSYTTTTTI